MTSRAVRLLLDCATSREVSDRSLCTASAKVCHTFPSSEEDDGDDDVNEDSEEGPRRRGRR
jgi:hypothetical protein